ncbi:MAG: hypothetical protein A2008_04175 [Candidatus Wallbacteria bacterium GWC2_49_35]|uniref:Amidohydrolase 3 domain-containing protein n=1 Tax=Candidatus Wallbacteria bacterium GWC2_49_35 TaxID=1817813 RepID=A0A1F7WUZ8_9BACT|nr:MAG: hypothetical protein A2008_04175 [Candidatus Wallbacteria bacterium GWC2_49_35]
MLDLILKNCNIIDGTSEVPYYSDIGILENAIVKVGNLKDFKAVKTIDCAGLYAAPGFIDAHSHSDLNAFIENGFDSKIRQGVTTEVIGNCGYSVYPLAGEFLEKVGAEAAEYGVEVNWRSLAQFCEAVRKCGKLKTNLVPLAGLSAIRASACGYSAKPLSSSELEKMKELTAQAMRDGASGVSSGLIYPPCCYFNPDEIVELLKIASQYGGLYATHMRSEGNAVLEAVNEAVSAARKARIPLQISHLKTAERHNWYKLDGVFELIEEARKEGADITADRYPYLASQTSLDMILPKWVFGSGDELSLRRLGDPLISMNIKKEIDNVHPMNSDYWESVMVSKAHVKEFLKFEGMNFRQVYNIIKTSRPDCQKFDIIDCLFYFLKKEKLKTSAIFFNMCERNLDRIIDKPYVMIGSDATARSTEGTLAKGKPHPRAFGTFVKYLTDYVKKKKNFSLSAAISKITSLPAKKFGLTARGRIAPAHFADIVIFDFQGLDDKSSFTSPVNYPDGIVYVIINGGISFSKYNDHPEIYSGELLLKN